jgi:hypothetical protein
LLAEIHELDLQRLNSRLIFCFYILCKTLDLTLDINQKLNIDLPANIELLAYLQLLLLTGRGLPA